MKINGWIVSVALVGCLVGCGETSSAEAKEQQATEGMFKGVDTSSGPIPIKSKSEMGQSNKPDAEATGNPGG